jgi:hypothetical protein
MLGPKESVMGIVMFTRPDGKDVAINTTQWHTVSEQIAGASGANTQIGFAGYGAAVQVKEPFKRVVDVLTKAYKEEREVA